MVSSTGTCIYRDRSSPPVFRNAVVRDVYDVGGGKQANLLVVTKSEDDASAMTGDSGALFVQQTGVPYDPTGQAPGSFRFYSDVT